MSKSSEKLPLQAVVQVAINLGLNFALDKVARLIKSTVLKLRSFYVVTVVGQCLSSLLALSLTIVFVSSLFLFLEIDWLSSNIVVILNYGLLSSLIFGGMLFLQSREKYFLETFGYNYLSDEIEKGKINFRKANKVSNTDLEGDSTQILARIERLEEIVKATALIVKDLREELVDENTWSQGQANFSSKGPASNRFQSSEKSTVTG